jgi:hypothetical protein
MPLTPYPLSDSASVTLDNSGSGSVRIGPKSLNTVWQVSGVSLSTTPSDPIPLATVYSGSASFVNRLAGTNNGSNDSTDLSVTLHPGEYLTVVWTDGQPTVTATVTVNGIVNGRQ